MYFLRMYNRSLDLFIIVIRVALCKYVFIFFTGFSIWTLLTYINSSRECTIIVSASNNFCFMETAVTHVMTNVLVISPPKTTLLQLTKL